MATRLLVVDDDEMNRDVLSRRLQRSGYETVTAADGPSALQILDIQPMDMVLLDEMMPGMSGTDVLLRIRQKFPASQLPVMMVTAVPESDGLVAAMRSGANDYITKPLDWPVALARIETRLSLASTNRELRHATELYRLASSAADEGLWDWDLTTGWLYLSPGWKHVLGYNENEIECSSDQWLDLLHPVDREFWRAELDARILGKSAPLEIEFRMRRKDGRYLWVECRGGVSRDAAGNPVRLAGHLTDVTARRTLDPATQLSNRTWLESELESTPDPPEAFALALLELHGFDRYHETVSIESSRAMLRRVVAGLQESLQDLSLESCADLVRSAEREFAVLFRNAGSPLELQRLVDSLKRAIDGIFGEDGEGSFVTAIAALAVPAVGEPLPVLLRDAQSALRHARERGSTGATLFDEAMRRHEKNEMRLESDLRRAVERGQLVVYYQPKIDLEYGTIAGFEALVRWNRPEFGLVMPNDFIPMAERTGLIVPIGMAVLKRACEETALLRQSFPRAEVSVNVSGRQFSEPNLVEQVRQVLAITGLDPEALRLEVTETVVVNDAASALITMRQFRKMGVGLKLDDFGSGYSSLAYLQQFPFDTLKIDRSFVVGMTAGAEGGAIVRAIIEMARSLHLYVVAEGIETLEQAEQLRALGCRYGQGYLFSRPVPLSRLRELLADWIMPELTAPAACRPEVGQELFR